MKLSETSVKRYYLIFIIIVSCLVSGVLFPIIDFSPQGMLRVKPFIGMFIIFAAVMAYISLGRMQAGIFINKDVFFIALFNLVLAGTGLAVRYYFDRGSLDFTGMNITIQLLLITLVTASSALRQIHRIKRS